jgi:hypothetical protein
MVDFEMLHDCCRIYKGRVIAMLLLTILRRNLEGTIEPVALFVLLLDYLKAEYSQ